MSEDETPAESGAPPPPPEAATPPAASRRVPWLESGLVLALCAVVAGVAASPLWAPHLAPLLPWSQPPAHYRALAAQSAALARRVATLETSRGAEQQATAAQQQGLANRLSAVEARAAAANTAQIRKEIAELDERVDALQKRPSLSADDLAKMQQEIARIGSVTADLATRLPAVEKRVEALDAAGRGAAARLLALLQIREAVDRAQPFASEYRVLAAFAKGDPELSAAVMPLAKAADSGVVSRTALAQGLRDLARHVAGMPQPTPQSDWRSAAMARLRGLVKIRRVDEGAPKRADAAIDAAEAAMARGDLAGAVAALGKLSGTDAAAARPWLEAARARLAVERALADVERIILAQLGTGEPAPRKGAMEAPARSSGPS